MTDISVFGAGAFGTALAISLARAGRKVSLIARTTAHAKAMDAAGENAARLPGFSFPASLTPTDHATNPAPICLIAVPTPVLRAYLDRHGNALGGRMVVACCKGIDIASGLGPTGMIASACPTATAAILSGPGFAVDIAAGLPTALTLAAQTDQDAQILQTALSSANLRLYRTTDLVGVELGGALKNVIAIAAGIAIGAGLGESARAALITRGYAEMKRLALDLGALPETLSGLSGLGDLVLTCSSEKSRNFSLGLALGRGERTTKHVTVEGVTTAKAVSNIINYRKLDMPVTSAVSALLEQKITVQEAVEMLFSRPLKKE